jgi:hypothetical protein
MSSDRSSRKALPPSLEELESRLVPAVFNEQSIGGLITAIQEADGNSDTTNTINLATGTYILSGATTNEIQIQDHPAATKSLTITGQGFVEISGNSQDDTWNHRILEIDGNTNFTLKLVGLSVTGGNVPGTDPSTPAQGGGILIDGGNVILSNAMVFGNEVKGATGSAGALGVSGQNGKNGGKGGSAEGGGIYLASGTLTLINNSIIEVNTATGGLGGAGGAGAVQATSYAPSSPSSLNGARGDDGKNGSGFGAAGQPGGDGAQGKPARQAASLKNANGGEAGDGGDALGGGVYMAAGSLVIQNSTIEANTAQGGSGGLGGAPGRHTSVTHSGLTLTATRGYFGGNGGAGGNGGMGFPGATPGGRGGDGGKGGKGGTGSEGADAINGGGGGKGGSGGEADGGGVYMATGTLTVTASSVGGNSVLGGFARGGGNGDLGGHGGEGGWGNQGGSGGNGAVGGAPTMAGQQPGPGGNGNDGGNGGDAVDGADAGDGGDGNDGGDGGAAKGGGFYIAAGVITITQTSFLQNTAMGANGEDGGDGGRGGSGGLGGGAVQGGRGGAGVHGGNGGNGGNGGGGGKGGDGGKAGNGGNGGDGLGGAIYLAGGSLSITKGSFNNSVTGGNGGNGGGGGGGGPGGSGNVGGGGNNGGVGSAGGQGGNGGNGGSGGTGGNGGDAGHPGNGGNGEGGDIYVAAGSLSIANASLTGGSAKGGKAGTIGAPGALGDGGFGLPGGVAGPGGPGNTPGAPGKAGNAGANGIFGSAGKTVGPASDGKSSGDTVFNANTQVTSSVNPLPSSVSPTFAVSWSGSDGSGPGIASYSIFVSVNGRAFKAWLVKTTKTTALFTGTAGNTYGFYSIAIDKSGQVQPTPSSAQASTTAVSQLRSTITVSSPTVQSGSPITVALQAKDASGNNITTGGLTVLFKLGNPLGGKGIFSAVTDHGDGTYTATFMGTIAGSNTITATIDGLPVTSTAPVIKITPGPASLLNSTVVISSPSVRAGSGIVVALQTRDAAGNKETTGGLTFGFALGSMSGGQGVFSNLTDHNNGVYTATFTGTITGSNTISATIGTSLTSAAPTISVVPGPVSPAKSFVMLSSSSISAGSTTIVTLQAVDLEGNNETTGGLRVVFALGSTTGGKGVFSSVKDHTNGTYTAVLTGTNVGANTIIVAINGVKITSTAPPITVTPGTVSLAKSLVSVATPSVQSGGSDTVALQARDAFGNKETTGGLTVAFALGKGIAKGTFGQVADNGDGTYSVTFIGTTAGINVVDATVGTLPVTSLAPTVKVTPGQASLANSIVILSPTTIKLKGITKVTLQAKDAAGNKLVTGGLQILFLLGNSGSGQGNFGKIVDNHNGTYTSLFEGTTAGTNTITAEIGNQPPTSIPATITIT